MKKYDLHIHTHYSPCSINKPASVLARAKKIGLDGIAITDHNEIKGALETHSLNKDPNFEVIIGEEVMTDQCEVLAYYVKEKIKPGRYEDVIREIRRQGAVCSIAHPFSGGRRAHIDPDFFEKLPRKFLPDALETFNGRIVFSSANKRAKALAEKLGLAQTGGSDGHFLFELGTGYTTFEKDLRTTLECRITKSYGKRKLAVMRRLLSFFVLKFKRLI
jgi:predicted metal-dependent phosphoesterase TrpH